MGHEATERSLSSFKKRYIVRPKTSKSLNTFVYIDGFNLYYSLRHTSYKWLNIKKLIEDIIDPSLHKILKIKYFTAVSVNRNSAQRQDVYLRALRTLKDFDIILGRHKRRRVKGRLIKYDNESEKNYVSREKVEISKYEEKETDVNIASYIVYDSCKKNIDCIALLSNDTDLKTPLKIVKYRLKKKVVIITPTKSLENPGDSILCNKSHIELKKLSGVNLQIEESHLKNSQFQNTIGKISKPKHWF